MFDDGLEHPDITKVNRDGYLHESETPQTVGECADCLTTITDEHDFIEWESGDKLFFCSEECLIGYIREDISEIGAKKVFNR